MADLFTELPLFPVALTFGAYQIGLWCQKKTRSALCNPIVIGAVLVMGVLLLTGISPAYYDAQMSGISWLLTPATVCLAVPLHRHLKALKKSLPAVIAGVLAGTVTSLVCVLLMCGLFALDRQFTVSLLPKSITTAIGIVLSEENGGIPTLTFVAILITGILGNLTGSFLCRLLRLTDPVSQGVAFGTASHLVGTTRAAEVDPIAGAVSSLSLVVAGVFTALIFPLVCNFIA